MKLQWESDGSSHSVAGGSGRLYEIVPMLLYGAPNGWCLKADGGVVQYDHSLSECKRTAERLEERASLS